MGKEEKQRARWTLFEKIFLILSLTIILICFLISKDKNYLSVGCSLLGVVAVLSVAKGLFWAPFINLVYNTIYAILSFTQGLYGEFIIGIGLMNILCVLTIIDWFKHKKNDDDIVVVNKIKIKEYLILAIVLIIASVGFYFLLKAFNTDQLIVSTISLVGSLVASYLSLRRSSNYAFGYIFNDVVLIVMWSVNMFNNGIGFLPTVVCFIVFLVNDIYGVIHWKMEEKHQLK